MARPRRPYSNFTPYEFDVYCATLAKTGNYAMAAESIRRPAGSLLNRRKVDDSFAARCAAALAQYRAGQLGPTPLATARAKRNDLRAAGGEWVVMRGKNGHAQVRRARPGQMTEAALDAFLDALAATANLTLSAHSVGVTTHAIAYRRKRDLGFDQLVGDAMEIGVLRLRDQLLETAMLSLTERTDAAGDRGMAPPEPPGIRRMDASEILAFLAKQEAWLANPPAWSPEKRQAMLDLGFAKIEHTLDRLAREARVKAGLPEVETGDGEGSGAGA